MNLYRAMQFACLIFSLLLSMPSKILAAEKDKEKPFGDLAYRLIGPNIGGRISSVAGVPGNSQIVYFAAAQGGVWKSENAGRDFSPIFDQEESQSMGSLAIAPSDPNVIYVGGGEANPRGNVMLGLGIWKSLDAGKTWQHIWKTHGQIGKIIVHPQDAKIAFAAVLGSPFAANSDRGVYRTLDGGKNWSQVLKKDADTGASDVSFDPSNANILFAGMWQMRRTPWSNQSGGEGSGLYRSNDAGESWTALSKSGLPDGPWGKVGVRVAASDASRVYALIEAAEGGLFRSDDGGENWLRVNAHRSLRQRAWYYQSLTIDPNNADVIWFPQVPLLKSIDGGKTITQVKGPQHGDHHEVWIDPTNSARVITGHDGGIDLSEDGGKTWLHPSLPLAQFYNIDVDDRVPYFVGGTIQDQGSASGPSRSLENEANGIANFRYVGGGEAGDFVYDRSQVGAVYAGEYGGFLSHYNESNGQSRNVTIWPANPSGKKPKDYKYRFQWTAPLASSPHDPKIIYHAANVLFRSNDQGASWATISPDLTRDDKSKQGWSGGPITGDITGVETYNTIFSIAESAVSAGTIWVGSDDGLVHLSRDAGASWKNVTPTQLPEWATIEAIETSRANASNAYIVAHNYRLGDNKPYVFFTSDFGQTWRLTTRGLPIDLLTWVIREDIADPKVLYLGTDRGVWFSQDAGASWQSLQLNLPAIAVTDLEVKHGDLIVATRGRSIWVLEDIAQLRMLDSVRNQSLAVLPNKAGVRFRTGYRWDDGLPGSNANPAVGAAIGYWLKAETKSELTLEILDSNQKIIRSLTSQIKPAKYGKDDPDEPSDKEPEAELKTSAGFHRVTWDLRYEGAKRLQAKLDAGNPEQGPLALPGRYKIVLRMGDQVAEGFVDVLADPRGGISAEDVRANFDFAIELRGYLNRALSAIETVQSIHTQAQDLKTRQLANPNAKNLLLSAESVIKQCDEIENAMHNPKAEVVYDILAGREGGSKLYSQLAPLYSWAQDSDYAPSQGIRERRDELLTQLQTQESAIDGLIKNQLAGLEQEVQKLKLTRIILPAKID